ncbi:conserved protein of unknown function [Rhodovastum atsumiense]|uniref:HlyD family efflux transporter periplasmic adaptor subunit n=1 Tax=Rhodovastum atsumiense TaxID=504468 RepID=A0A5M6IV43_9PROT|nr:hypothetical protein [Rhodovastum atsumiense]KAA5612142.1 hypothetical protein F1189_10770 [Rhodovastum atsumiense]CAH2603914.1 conserved protein of unknown function [Rhodovastum atsumiense]
MKDNDATLSPDPRKELMRFFALLRSASERRATLDSFGNTPRDPEAGIDRAGFHRVTAPVPWPIPPVPSPAESHVRASPEAGSGPRQELMRVFVVICEYSESRSNTLPSWQTAGSDPTPWWLPPEGPAQVRDGISHVPASRPGEELTRVFAILRADAEDKAPCTGFGGTPPSPEDGVAQAQWQDWVARLSRQEAPPESATAAPTGQRKPPAAPLPSPPSPLPIRADTPPPPPTTVLSMDSHTPAPAGEDRNPPTEASPVATPPALDAPAVMPAPGEGEPNVRSLPLHATPPRAESVALPKKTINLLQQPGQKPARPVRTRAFAYAVTFLLVLGGAAEMLMQNSALAPPLLIAVIDAPLLTLRAPHAGYLQSVSATEGEVVQAGTVLFTLRRSASPDPAAAGMQSQPMDAPLLDEGVISLKTERTALVWSLPVRPGSEVAAGNGLGQVVDCTRLFLVAATPAGATASFTQGQQVGILFAGSTGPVSGTVGARSTAGNDVLGRNSDLIITADTQAIVAASHSACPIGRTARITRPPARSP